ncbi:MAG: hypothetical protein HY314_11510 [Acidobacteria bacterium]|nr:hypothetical protein [Acidobacteriota bacterium]
MKKAWMLFGFLIWLIFALLPDTGVLSQQSAPALRQEAFEVVWQRVKEKHYDPTLNGVDWDAVHEKYAPRVAAVKTDDELYSLLNQMLGELKESHFLVFPPSVYVGEEEKEQTPPERAGGSEAGNPREGVVGLQIKLVEGRPTITCVEPNSAAARAGLRPGFIVTHVGDASVEEIQQKVAARKERPTIEQFMFVRAVAGRLGGAVDSTVAVRYLDQDDKPHTVELKRGSPEGEPIKFGELPRLYAKIETKRLANGIGYVRFNIFLVPLLAKIQQAIKSLHDAPGIILDLRGNPGGVAGMAAGVARLFCSEQSLLGTMKLRRGEIRFVVYPIQEQLPYRGPLAILTDEGTASTSEILAGGMQESGRAIIVGQPSTGAVLPSVVEKLPIGARLQYAIADFKTPKGILLEGRGVQPNVVVEITRRDLLAGLDPVLEKGISVLLKQRAQSAASKSSQ